ncbi:hypothetical protein GCM10028807_51890 [Spirosoma daeguense]
MLNQRPDTDKTYQQAAEQLKLIAHPLRLRILLALLKHPPMPVVALQKLLNAEKPSFSNQLIKLKDHGLLLSKRQGLTTHYALANPALIEQLREVMSRLNKNIGGGGLEKTDV